MLSTSFTELLGCRLPLQQAPMGGVTTPELVAAVAGAGEAGEVVGAGEIVHRLLHRLDVEGLPAVPA